MREGDIMCTTKMAEATSENRTRDQWSEVCRIKGINKFLHFCVDDMVGDDEIAERLF